MASLDLSIQPKKVTLAVAGGKPQPIQFYRNSAVLTVANGDSVVIKTESSAEEAYYKSLAVTGIITVTSASLE